MSQGLLEKNQVKTKQNKKQQQENHLIQAKI